MIPDVPRTHRFDVARALCAATVLALLAGCAAPARRVPSDPLERLNRVVYEFNDVTDRYAIKPVAKVYDSVLPGPVKQGVRNFFSNLDDVVVVINDVLQGRPNNFAHDSVRLVSNTIFGVLGIFDVASMRGISKRSEDFGQTLAVWGVPSGPYLVLPFLGPGTLRDGPARFVDSLFDPVWQISNVPERNVTVGVRLVDTRASLLPAERLLDQASVDRYSFLRDAYLQRRVNLIYDGNPPRPKDDLDDPEDPDDLTDEQMKMAPDRDLPNVVPPSAVPIPTPNLPSLR
jgi:phospholipid-binding lipoprotein MlaA